jgi:tetratricopeptide (TPR) repeat protein
MMLRGFAGMLLLLALRGAAAAVSDVTPESARVQFETMHTEEAQRQFEQLNAQKPDDPAVLYYLGRIQLRQHHRKQAVLALRRAVELRPEITDYQLSLCDALGAYIDEQPFYRKLGLAEEIHKHLLMALANDPRSTDVHDGLMKFYLSAPALIGGSHDKALQEAARIAVLNPARGHVAYGLIADHDERFVDAEREFLAAIQIAPDDLLQRYELGQAQLAQRHYEAAFGTFEGLIRRFPRETAAYYYFAGVAVQSGQRLERAAEALKTYLSRGPTSDDDPSPVLAYRLLGRLSELTAHSDQARSAYRTALQLDPADTEIAQALQKLD